MNIASLIIMALFILAALVGVVLSLAIPAAIIIVIIIVVKKSKKKKAAAEAAEPSYAADATQE